MSEDHTQALKGKGRGGLVGTSASLYCFGPPLLSTFTECYNFNFLLFLFLFLKKAKITTHYLVKSKRMRVPSTWTSIVSQGVGGGEIHDQCSNEFTVLCNPDIRRNSTSKRPNNCDYSPVPTEYRTSVCAYVLAPSV